jgi:hypothetical protein
MDGDVNPSKDAFGKNVTRRDVIEDRNRVMKLSEYVL